MLKLKSTADTVFSRRRLGLLGRPGDGKSLTAFSVSEHFDPTFSKPVSLEDILVVQFDDGGFESAAARRVMVSKYYDFVEIINEKDFNLELKAVIGEAKDMATRGDIKAVIFDGVSAANRKWYAWAFDRYGKNYGTNDEMLKRHMDFYRECMSLPCHALFTFQPKPKPENQSDNTNINSFDQVLDIYSSHGNVYRENMAIWTVRKEVKNGKPEVAIYPNGVGGVEGKDRHDLNPKEAPNVRDIFKRIDERLSTKAA